jgi:hypothetical protein
VFIVVVAKIQPLTAQTGALYVAASSTTEIGNGIQNCLDWLIRWLRRLHQLTSMTKGYNTYKEMFQKW